MVEIVTIKTRIWTCLAVCATLAGLGWIILTGGGGMYSSNWSEASEKIREDGIHLSLFP